MHFYISDLIVDKKRLAGALQYEHTHASLELLLRMTSRHLAGVSAEKTVVHHHIVHNAMHCSVMLHIAIQVTCALLSPYLQSEGSQLACHKQRSQALNGIMGVSSSCVCVQEKSLLSLKQL